MFYVQRFGAAFAFHMKISPHIGYESWLISEAFGELQLIYFTAISSKMDFRRIEKNYQFCFRNIVGCLL